MDNIMEISHLHKSFGAVKAVQDLNFCVKKGELFAFLGVNGAGKSTTINIMCGELRKDSGSVLIGGADLDKEPDSIRRKLGVVFQSSVLDKDLSVRDNLRSRAALYGIHGEAFEKRLAELTELLDFSDLLQAPLGQALRRPAPAHRHCPGAAARAGNSDSGRTHHRPGSPDPHQLLWQVIGRPASGAGHDGVSHHPLYGGGGGRRLCGHFRPRQHRRRGHAPRR